MPEAGDSRSLHVLALVRVRSRPASPRPSRSGWYGYFRGWQLPENQTCHGPKHARPMCSGRPLKYSQTLCYSYDTEWYRETHARTPRSKNRGVFVDAKHPPVGFEPTALGSEDQRSTSELRGDRPRTGSTRSRERIGRRMQQEEQQNNPFRVEQDLLYAKCFFRKSDVCLC